MRLKYYLRGAGIGVLVTTLIFITVLAFSKANRPTTDDQIIADALALGMVFPDDDKTSAESVTQEPANTEDAQKTENTDNEQLAQTLEEIKTLTDAAATEQANLEATKADTASKNSDEVKSSDEIKAQEPKVEDTKTEEKKTETVKSEDTKTDTKKTESSSAGSTTTTQEKIPFTVGGGDSSYAVAKNLVSAGLVSDASAYDKYLESNGYDRKLRTGTFYLTSDMSEEEIAQVLIGNNRTTSPVQ